MGKLTKYTGNKKVRNATPLEFSGIKFRSNLEVYCYKQLLKITIDVVYEGWKEVLQHKFIPRVHVFEASKKTNDMTLNKLVREITYTPDFYLKTWNTEKKMYNYIFIETKGMQNDAYPIKKKLFLQNFQEGVADIYFFEPRNQRQVDQCIEIIKPLINVT